MKKTIFLCVLSAVVGASLAIVLHDPPDTQPKTVAQESPRWTPPAAAAAERTAIGLAGSPQPPGDGKLTPEERVNVAVYENVNRGVVNINTRSVRTDLFFMQELTSKGEGSGTVIDRQGHVLTNFHVVQGARDIQVTLYNGKTFEARMVGGDEPTDVAVLKIDAPADSLFPVSFGTSTGLKVGQRVFAIGNPFGFERTLSTGIISSLNRTLSPRRGGGRKLKSLIQIDAAINPGNSGGPLLDTRARMIGMNTAIASAVGESAGVGFAIPVNTITRIVPELIRNGRVLRGDIGIDAVYRTEEGLLIARLVPGGPAEKAGLRGPRVVRRRQGPIVFQSIDRLAADLIVAVDGKPAKRVDEFLDVIDSKKPGEEVVVTIIRDGKQQRVTVRLEAEE